MLMLPFSVSSCSRKSQQNWFLFQAVCVKKLNVMSVAVCLQEGEWSQTLEAPSAGQHLSHLRQGCKRRLQASLARFAS